MESVSKLGIGGDNFVARDAVSCRLGFVKCSFSSMSFEVVLQLERRKSRKVHLEIILWRVTIFLG